jgi:hypothetical protein
MNQTLKLLDNDKIEYYTPNWVWDSVKQFIPKDKIIWEAFRNESDASTQSANYLRELGFKVVNPLCDFFENNYGDIVVSNPPYNVKQKVLERLISLQKPFLLILPNIILNSCYFIQLAKKNTDIQIIILPKRVDFIKPSSEKSKSTFHTLIICYKLNLKDRIIFL